MTETVVAGTVVPTIHDIIESISDFVTRQEQSVAEPGCAASRRSKPFAMREELPSLFDNVVPARAASSYSRSAAARRADRFRKAVYLLAIVCI